MSTATLTIDVSASGTGPPPGAEPRAIAGEDLWLPPTGSAGVVVTERTAMSLAAVLATFNVLATDVAVLPLCTYQRQADGGRREAREHPVDRLLRVSPDDETTPIRWRQALMGHALSRGNGYAEVQRKGRGTPIALHLLGPDTTRPERRGGRLGYDVGGGKWLESANVLHVAGLGDDGLSGFNFVRMLRQAIGLGIAGDTYAADYFSNGAEPRVVLEVPNKLDGPAAANLRNSWNARHGGPGQRHGTAVLEQGTKANVISTNPEESQLLETRKFQALDAVRPWRVPPHKIGDFSEAHLANLEAANLDYLMTALMGWLTAIEQEFTLKLLTAVEREAGYYVEHNVNALLRGDSRGRFESYNTALNGGWMNRDEVRRRENMNPIGEAEGGELYLVQSQNIPLSDVGKEPPAPPGGATVPAPADENRFNPHHGKDGKFTTKGGHGIAIGGKVPPKGGGGEGADAPAAESGKDLGGASIKEVKDYHNSMSQDDVAKMSEKEKGAIQGYSSSLYTQVNDLHRKGEVTGGYQKADIKKLSDSMDSALDKASLKESVKVYRGVSDAAGLGLKPGAVIHDKAFLSTSLTPKVAEHFGRQKGGAVIEITAPKGSKGVSVAGLTNRKGENEVLFARGSKMKVTGVRTEGKRTIYTAELQ